MKPTYRLAPLGLSLWLAKRRAKYSPHTGQETFPYYHRNAREMVRRALHQQWHDYKPRGQTRNRQGNRNRRFRRWQRERGWEVWFEGTCFTLIGPYLDSTKT